MKTAASICALLTVASTWVKVQAEDLFDNVDVYEGGVEIVIGDDPDQFAIGWSDGVCYLPVEGAREGDKLTFDHFQHNVYKMPDAEAMNKCDFSQATLLSSQSGYQYIISPQDIASGSSLYFACEVGSHCFGEQRVEVNLDTTSTGPRAYADLPKSKFILGASSSSCTAVRAGEITVEAASRVGESTCSEPEYREATDEIDRPHYFRSCLGPPITLTPGGVINQALILNFPFPTDRRVLLGSRTWEFVQGDLESLEPVNVNQLYIHHIAGSVILGNGAENIRQTEEDAAFDLPYGFLSGDLDDRMIFHLIDLRETGEYWLECLECRCKNGTGTYLGTGGSGEEGDPNGGISCCTNCTDLTTPTIDYRLRYNVTYTDLDEVDVPIKPLVLIVADVAPAVDRYIEFDVPQWQDLPEEHVLEGNPKVQVLEQVGTVREMFGGYFPGATFTGNNLLEVHRCIGHLHVAALGMWLYDDLTGELLCHNDVEYGTDPDADVGFIRSISVTNYDPPLEILAERKVRLVTHYDAEVIHTGVMGLLLFMIAEKEQEVGVPEAKLVADLCAAPRCDVAAVLPNGGCRNSIEDSIICRFGGLCECEDLMGMSDTVGGCSGVYMSSFGNITVGSLCAEYCGCGVDLLEESIVEQIEQETKNRCHYAGENCTRYLANVYACAQPWAKGADGFEENVMSVVARRGKRMALEGTKLGDSSMHRFDAIRVEDMEISPCNPEDFPILETESETASVTEKKSSNFHPLYLFPLVVALLIAGLGFYAMKARKNKAIPPTTADAVVIEAGKVDEEIL